MIVVRCAGVELAGAPEWVHILPLGAWRGHPSGVQFVVDAAACRQVVENFDRRGVDVPIDWEHATELVAVTGRPAASAGWIKAMRALEDGVWARCAWSDLGRASVLPAREGAEPAYRYVSPVIRPLALDETTRAPRGMAVLSLALTNVPFFGGALRPVLQGVAGVASGRVAASYSQGASSPPGDLMLLTMLLAALGMPETTTEEQAIAEVKRLKALDAPEVAAATAVGEAVCTGLGVAGDAALSAVPGLLSRPTHEALFDAQLALARAGATQAADVAASAIDDALKAGKITPAMKGDVERFMAADKVACSAYLAKLPPIPALSGRSQAGATTTTTALSAEERAVCDALSLTPAEYLAGRSNVS